MTNEQKAFLYTGQSKYDIPMNVTHVKIDPSVKVIGACAFRGRSQLSIVELSKGLKRIDSWAFDNCTSLERITIPSTVRLVGRYAFFGCTQLKIVERCEGFEHINYAAFTHCTSLERITIPSSVRVVGRRAFQGCTQLKIVELCEGLELIDAWAFWKCTSLKRINIPSTVKSIDKYAFYCCAGWDAIKFSKETEKFLLEVSLWKWLVDDATHYQLPQRYSLLARRSFPKRLDMIELTTGKLRIRDLLTRIPSIAPRDLDVHVDSIDLELDTYEQMQTCITASLENCKLLFIIPQVLSFLLKD